MRLFALCWDFKIDLHLIRNSIAFVANFKFEPIDHK